MEWTRTALPSTNSLSEAKSLHELMGLAVTPRRGFAQGSVTATLSGTVFDSSGAVVPGATIIAKNKGTASTTTAVSGADGLFTIPALEPGNYTVTFTMQGFKTAILEDVRQNAGVKSRRNVALSRASGDH